MKLDILAFGAHPDDVELACSGTIIKHIVMGYHVGIIDLTRGELGSRGNAALRLTEAENAARIQGVEVRDNLDLGDGFFQDNMDNQLKIVEKIRQYRPDVVFCNAPFDRHPDHGRASEMVSRACFLSGLVKIETAFDGQMQEQWRPRAVYHYIQDRYMKPDFVVDVTDTMEKKMLAIKAFSSQFYDPESKEPQTPISTPEFLQFVTSRMMDCGRITGVKYGEGFTTERSIGVGDITTLL